MSASDVAQLLAAGAAGILVFFVSGPVLRDHSVFSEASAWVIAFCIAALASIALMADLPSSHTDVPPDESTRRRSIDFVLMPYGALGIVLLLLIVLRGRARILSRFPRRKRGSCHCEEAGIRGENPVRKPNAWVTMSRTPGRKPHGRDLPH